LWFWLLRVRVPSATPSFRADWNEEDVTFFNPTTFRERGSEVQFSPGIIQFKPVFTDGVRPRKVVE
jgi:hypothetical protein